MEKNWVFQDDVDEELIQDLKKQTNLSETAIKLVALRGHTTKQQIESFLDPNKEVYHDPFLMKDMDKAVERIIKALVRQEKILIWGDFDLDGISSVSLLYLFLKSLRAKVTYLIPDREKDGYGLSKEGIDKAIGFGADLIVTVDCGITSIEQAEHAKTHNLDIIITDHHEPANELPDVYAIVDPKRKDCPYPFKHLAGVGVAFKLMQGILLKSEMPITDANEHLDLVTIGTSADIVPLIGENRKIVISGLKALTRTRKVGLKLLLRKLNLDQKSISVNHIIFGLAPRLNAAGRMGDAERAVRLLTSNSQKAANELVKILEVENELRKTIDSQTLKEAVRLNKEVNKFDPDVHKSIVVAHEEWHVGVIGIVASRLLEEYHRPAVVISIEDGVGKGSCRSISNVNVYEVLKECSDLLIQFGGHEYAAGLLIEEENIQEFQDRFNNIVSKIISFDDLRPSINIDTEITFDQIDRNLSNILETFEPYGPDNKQPIFFAKGVEVIGHPRVVGANHDPRNKHLKLKLRQFGVVHDAIGFKLADRYDIVSTDRAMIDIAFNIENNTWNGTTYIQLKIKDIKQG